MNNQYKIAILYILLGAGGLWHLLGVFQFVMAWLAGPMLISLGFWIGWEFYTALERYRRGRYIFWALFVIIGSFLLERIGVQTGLIFGQYEYGDALSPAIDGVPVAIGFAWLLVALSSVAVSNFLLDWFALPTSCKTVLGGAVLMVAFDFFLEHVAMKLGYWQWNGGAIPWENYSAWLAVGLIFLLAGWLAPIFPKKTPPIGVYFYTAQLLYFGLVLI